MKFCGRVRIWALNMTISRQRGQNKGIDGEDQRYEKRKIVGGECRAVILGGEKDFIKMQKYFLI